MTVQPLPSTTRKASPLRTFITVRKAELGLRLQEQQWRMPKLLTLVTPRSPCLSEMQPVLRPLLITAAGPGTATTRRITSSAKELLLIRRALMELQVQLLPAHRL
ncbi:hypothetical protein D3C86_1395570 [compost metagenome]